MKEIEEALKPCEPEFSKKENNIVFSFTEFVNFVKNTYSNATTFEESEKLSTNKTDVIHCIDSIYKYVKSPAVKRKLTRTKNNLIKYNFQEEITITNSEQEDESETESVILNQN